MRDKERSARTLLLSFRQRVDEIIDRPIALRSKKKKVRKHSFYAVTERAHGMIGHLISCRGVRPVVVVAVRDDWWTSREIL